jgi:hypothetical protein
MSRASCADGNVRSTPIRSGRSATLPGAQPSLCCKHLEPPARSYSSSSSLAIEAESAGCDTVALVAAFVKLPVSATAAKCRNLVELHAINFVYPIYKNIRFHLWLVNKYMSARRRSADRQSKKTGRQRMTKLKGQSDADLRLQCC